MYIIFISVLAILVDQVKWTQIKMWNIWKLNMLNVSLILFEHIFYGFSFC